MISEREIDTIAGLRRLSWGDRIRVDYRSVHGDVPACIEGVVVSPATRRDQNDAEVGLLVGEQRPSTDPLPNRRLRMVGDSEGGLLCVWLDTRNGARWHQLARKTPTPRAFRLTDYDDG